MLLQSLVAIAAMLVLTGSILVETLVTAKGALHQAMAAPTQTAMADATASFVAWAQERVKTYGAGNAAAWPSPSAPVPDPNVCPALFPGGAPTPAPCTFAASASWKISGATAAGGLAGSTPAPGLADAQNLAPTVNEQRLAAKITVRITDLSGQTTFASRTRDVTARIFEAAPYVVITGERDVTSEVGSIHAGEGDTGGTAQAGTIMGKSFSTPNPTYPAADTETRIRTSVDCTNRPAFDLKSYAEPAKAGEIDYSLHPYGNRDWAYEIACLPPGGVPNPQNAPAGYIPPVGATYSVYPASPNYKNWIPGVENPESFPR